MKKKKIILIIMLTMLTVFFLNGCNENSTQSENSENTNAQNNLVKDSSEKQEVKKPKGLEETSSDKMYALNDNIFNIDEAVTYDEIEYLVTEIDITKKIGNHNKEDITYFSETVDDDGDIVSGQSYAYVYLTIKNHADIEKEITLNSNTFVTISEDESIDETATEARYLNPQQNHENPTEQFHYILQKNEEVSVEIAYILNDEIITDNLHYFIGNSGSDLDNANNKFIRVGELD